MRLETARDKTCVLERISPITVSLLKRNSGVAATVLTVQELAGHA
jgi:hypothetical protein